MFWRTHHIVRVLFVESCFYGAVANALLMVQSAGLAIWKFSIIKAQLYERGRKSCSRNTLSTWGLVLRADSWSSLQPCFANLRRSKAITAVIQQGADHLLDEERIAYTILKSPFQFPQKTTQRIWEKQSDKKKGWTRSAQSACHPYSAGSWDGERHLREIWHPASV